MRDTSFDHLDNDGLDEAIAKAMGWEKLPWPAFPRWQKPGKNGFVCLYSMPNWTINFTSTRNLLDKLTASFFRVNLMKGDIDNNWTLECSSKQGVDVYRGFYVEDQKIERAICKAYLVYARDFQSIERE